MKIFWRATVLIGGPLAGVLLGAAAVLMVHALFGKPDMGWDALNQFLLGVMAGGLAGSAFGAIAAFQFSARALKRTAAALWLTIALVLTLIILARSAGLLGAGKA